MIRRWLCCLVTIAAAMGCAAPRAAAPAPAIGPTDQAQAEWDWVLAAAKAEGKVSVIIPTGAEVREALVAPFEARYGITVDAWAARGSEIPPRVQNERSAGQYLWDVYVGGGTQIFTSLIPMAALDVTESALILPEVKDPQKWRGGGIEYLDAERRAIVMTPFLRGCVFVNPNMVDPKSITSFKDLLDPRWKGRMVLDDPRRAGPGNAMFTLFYLHPELGPDFIRALGKQEPVIMTDYGQEVDAIGQGRYPILLGSSDNIVEERMKQGVPITIVAATQMRELCDVSPANGDVALMMNAPRPNAARVYINWLLTQEGQTAFVRATGYVSSRLDAPTDQALPWRVPVPGAIKSYTKEAIDLKDEVNAIAEEALGR